MKRFLLILFVLASLGSAAQNVQLHYDMGKDRGYFTSTIEMFKPDKWGSTFFFVDMDYNVGEVEGVSLAYLEFARDLKFWDGPVAIHAEFNGGFGQFKISDELNGAFTINNAWLGGLSYALNNEDFTRGITFQALYKNIANTPDDKPHNFQVTAVWYMHFLDGKLSFTGFADFWKQNQGSTDYVFLSEPQLWYNATENLSLGGEVELSQNFVSDEFEVMPTLAVKWNF
ncbi:MAG: DUF5020 family protein [Bacteroidales bacterium]|jgi:hypothetical protein